MLILDFYATWCGPCKKQTPIIEELQKEYPNINIATVDVDADPVLAQKYGVMSIPTIIFLDDDPDKEPLERLVGFTPKAKLVELIEKHKDLWDGINSLHNYH